MRTSIELERATHELPSGVGEMGTRAGWAVHEAVLRSPAARRATDFLHGTWLGHPLHAVLTDVTVGAWAVAAAFDAVGELEDSDEARRIGDRLTEVGAGSAVATALSGLADFTTIPKPAATTGTVHGLLNVLNLGLYALSIRDRRRGERRRALAWSMSAFGLTLASSWLGGHLVYKHGVGTDHAEDFGGADDWTPVLDEAELKHQKPKAVELDGKRILIYRDGHEIHAIGAVCSHAGGPLEEGDFDGWCVQCPWHDSVFDLRDGRNVHGPAAHPQPVFDARLQDGRVEVRLRRT